MPSALPHQRWWKKFLRDSRDTGFRHETYSMRGGMEAIYDDTRPTGMLRFAPAQPAKGSLFSARARLHIPGEPDLPPAVAEEETAAVPETRV
jgi:hypothetical protein